MWSDSSPNFSLNVCRLCANISDVVIPIFGKEGDKERLDLKIKKCLPIVIREEDFKPKQVCYNCATKLEVCAELVDMCLASEFKFDSVLQSRYPGLKPVDSEQMQQDENEEEKTQLQEPSLSVVPLIDQSSKAVEHSSNNTLTVSHEGGVIVLSKVDTDPNHQQREECQDILLMVELKYNKDLPESQQATIAKAHTITYTVEPQDGSLTKVSSQPFTVDGSKSTDLTYNNPAQSKQPALAYVESQPIAGAKTFTLAYSPDQQPQIISKSSSVAFATEAQPVMVSKAHIYPYPADLQSTSLTHKTQTLTYPSSGTLAPNKTHTLVFTADAQPMALTKDPLEFSAEGIRPVALVKSNGLAYQEQDSEASDKAEDIFVGDRQEDDEEDEKSREQLGDKSKILSFPDDTEIVLGGSVTAEAILLDGSAEADVEYKEAAGVTAVVAEAVPEASMSEAGAQPGVIKREKPFPCTVCGKSFMRRTNLNVHMAVHTQVRPHQCDLCGKRFVLKWDLTLHQRIHAGLFSCEFCNKAFSVRGKLERHRRTHTGERPFPCATCGKAFGDKRNLESHLRTHSGERPYACGVCGRSFRVRSHLSDHRRVHSQDTPYTCHTCGKSFKWKTNLNIHLKLHTGERFPCEECGREFGRRADLLKHQRSHTGDRPHACGLCSKSYGDKALLQKHLRSHSEHKPYSCDVCGKSFHFHWYLNTHKKIHCEQRSFPCNTCGKHFSKRGNLVFHVRTCHLPDPLAPFPQPASSQPQPPPQPPPPPPQPSPALLATN